MKAALGIDTSCYTTSVALAVEDGALLSRRRLLDVEQGARGLRQSEALFQHVQRLPALLEDMLSKAGEAQIACVCASARPRDAEGSYMPVFTAGTGFARAIAASLRVPFYETSHQQGHVRAAMEGAGALPEEFLALHLSGGTTEALRVRPGLKVELLGGSNDLHAGQLVDRVGVRMGLSFPAGPALEKLARQGAAKSAFPLSHRGGRSLLLRGRGAGHAHARRRGVPRGCGGGGLFLSRPRGGLAHWLGLWKNAPQRGAHLRGRGVLGAFAGAFARATCNEVILPGALCAGASRKCRATTPAAWRSSVGRNTSMATILNGKQVAAEIRAELKTRAEALRKDGVVPCLAVLLAGDDPASKIYVRNKKRACEEIGIESRELLFPESVTEEELIAQIRALNEDPAVDAMLVQLPLPRHINEARVLAEIAPEKDADGFHVVNAGRLFTGQTSVLPCTPAGCMELLRRANVEFSGKHAVVVGRSNIVGKPMAMLLLNEHCTVTVCHSRTKDLARFTRDADILVAAVGRPGMITGDMIKPGAAVIDVGINRLDRRQADGRRGL